MLKSSKRILFSSTVNAHDHERLSRRQRNVSTFMENYKKRRKRDVNENRENENRYPCPSQIIGNSELLGVCSVLHDKESIGVLAEHIYKDYKENPALNNQQYPMPLANLNRESESDWIMDSNPEEEDHILRDIEEYLEQQYAEYLDDSLEQYLESCEPESPAPAGGESVFISRCGSSVRSSVSKQGIQVDEMDTDEPIEWSQNPDESLDLDAGLLCPCCQLQIMSVEGHTLLCFNCSASIPLCGQVKVVDGCVLNRTKHSDTNAGSSSSAGLLQNDNTASWGSSIPTGGDDATLAIEELKYQLREVYAMHDSWCRAHSRSHLGAISMSAASLQFSARGKACVKNNNFREPVLVRIALEFLNFQELRMKIQKTITVVTPAQFAAVDQIVMETGYNSSYESRLQDPVYMGHLGHLEYDAAKMGLGRMYLQDLSPDKASVTGTPTASINNRSTRSSRTSAMTTTDMKYRNQNCFPRTTNNALSTDSKHRVSVAKSMDERTLRHIVEASFKHRGLTEHSVVSSLRGMENLTSLDISCNAIEQWPFGTDSLPVAASATAPSVISTSSTINRHVYSRKQSPSSLSSCRHDHSVTLMNANANANVALTRTFRPLGLLLTLNMSHNLLQSMTSFSGCLHSLIELRLSHNDLRHCEGLSHCSTLSYLDLSHNSIQYVQGLETLSVLKVLNLSHNCISTLTDIRSLCFNTSLIEVDLSGNKKEIIEHSSVEDRPRVSTHQHSFTLGDSSASPVSIITTTTVVTTVSLLYEQYKLLLLDICPLIATLDDKPIVQTNKSGCIINTADSSLCVSMTGGGYHNTSKKISSYSSQLVKPLGGCAATASSPGTPVASYMRTGSSSGYNSCSSSPSVVKSGSSRSASGKQQQFNKPEVTHMYPRGLSVYRAASSSLSQSRQSNNSPNNRPSSASIAVNFTYGNHPGSPAQNSYDEVCGEEDDVKLYYYNGDGRALKTDSCSSESELTGPVVPSSRALSASRSTTTPVSVWRQPPKYAPKGGYWNNRASGPPSRSGHTTALGLNTSTNSRDAPISGGSTASVGASRSKFACNAPQTVSTSTTVSPSKTTTIVTRVDVTTVYAQGSRNSNAKQQRKSGVGEGERERDVVSSLVRKPFLSSYASSDVDCCVGNKTVSREFHQRSQSVDRKMLRSHSDADGVSPGTPRTLSRSRSVGRGRSESFFHASVPPHRDTNYRVVTPTLRGCNSRPHSPAPSRIRNDAWACSTAKSCFGVLTPTSAVSEPQAKRGSLPRFSSPVTNDLALVPVPVPVPVPVAISTAMPASTRVCVPAAVRRGTPLRSGARTGARTAAVTSTSSAVIPLQVPAVDPSPVSARLATVRHGQQSFPPSHGASAAATVVSASAPVTVIHSPIGVNDSYLQQYLQSVQGGLTSPVPEPACPHKSPSSTSSPLQNIDSLSASDQLVQQEASVSDPPLPYSERCEHDGGTPTRADDACYGLTRLLPDYVSSPSLHMDVHRHKLPQEKFEVHGRKKPGIIFDQDISCCDADTSVDHSVNNSTASMRADGVTDGDEDTDLEFPSYQRISDRGSGPAIEIDIPMTHFSQRVGSVSSNDSMSSGSSNQIGTCDDTNTGCDLEPFMVYNHKGSRKDHLNNFSVDSIEERTWGQTAGDSATVTRRNYDVVDDISALKTVHAKHNRSYSSKRVLDLELDFDMDLPPPPPPPTDFLSTGSYTNYTSSLISTAPISDGFAVAGGFKSNISISVYDNDNDDENDDNGSDLNNISHISVPQVNSPFFDGH